MDFLGLWFLRWDATDKIHVSPDGAEGLQAPPGVSAGGGLAPRNGLRVTGFTANSAISMSGWMDQMWTWAERRSSIRVRRNSLAFQGVPPAFPRMQSPILGRCDAQVKR